MRPIGRISRGWLVAATLAWAGAGAGTAWAEEERPHVVLLIAESEYRTAETLPAFAKSHLDADYRVTILNAPANEPGAIPGLEAIDTADVLVVSVRRRPLPPEQLERLRRYVGAGKPVVGIRTACHAFSLRNQPPPEGLADWPTFDPDVFGGHYTNHYPAGPATTVRLAPGAADDAILDGAAMEGFSSPGSLYKVSPVDTRARILLHGSTPGRPEEPVAWTFTRADGGRSFYTSLGHEGDFAQPAFVRLLRNAIDWASGRAPRGS